MADPRAELRGFQRGDFAACGWLIALAGFLFRDHLLRKLTFLGNPDRIQNNLKVVKFYIDSLHEHGALQAWNEHEFLGYDSFALPYINPNPLTFLYAAFGGEQLYVTAGYVSAALLAAAGIAAFVFLRRLVEERLPAAIGASLYMLSAICVLKVSQNDASFLAFVLMPLLLRALLAAGASVTRSTLAQALVLYLLIQFVFLQKVAYVLLLWGTYALFLAASRRDRRYLVAPALAFAGALIAAIPRLAGVALNVREHSRGIADAAERPSGVNLFELVRWLDSTVYGARFGDDTWHLNHINLSEGMLLYTAAFVPFAILAAAFLAKARAVAERRFFASALVALLAIVFVPWLIQAVWVLFGKMSFLHGRILIAGLVPVVALVALLLRDLRSERPLAAAPVAAGLVAGICIAIGIELLAGRKAGSIPVPAGFELWLREEFDPVAPTGWTPAAFAISALARIAMSAAFAVGLMVFARRRDALGTASLSALAAAMVTQALAGANFQINGPHTRGGDFLFRDGNISWVAPDRFIPPSASQVAAVHRMTDDRNFRSIVICEPRIAGGFCAGQVAEFWRLRLAEGYYGVGVPARMRALPWEGGAGMRDLSFSHQRGPQWPLLGVINVRNAIEFTPELYGYGQPQGAIEESRIVRNPSPVLPRAFFAARVVPVGSPTEAAGRMFDGGTPRDLRQISFVEGIAEPASFAASGGVELTGTGDRLAVRIDPAPQPRFLVLNELFSPRWTATADSQTLPVHAVNAVMRGVTVPPAVSQVDFVYRPVMSLWSSTLALLAGLLLLGLGTRWVSQ